MLDCTVVRTDIVPDDKASADFCCRHARCRGRPADNDGRAFGDPDDVTRQALVEAGLTDVLHGVPVLPGTMSLMGRIPAPGRYAGAGRARRCIIKPPFSLVLPRILSGRGLTRAEAARMGEGSAWHAYLHLSQVLVR